MWPLFVATAMVDGVETGSTKSLGVHLSADDVAAAIYQATHPGPEVAVAGALPGRPADQGVGCSVPGVT